MTSALQRYVGDRLRFYFSRYKIIENHRPVWLLNKEGNRLELDFYIPMLNVAIEVQGDQHYQYVEFMHGDMSGFQKRKRDDQKKRDICEERGITLVEIASTHELADLINRLDTFVNPPSTLPPMTEEAEQNRKSRKTSTLIKRIAIKDHIKKQKSKRSKKYSLVCKECGNGFESINKNKQYCCPSCSKRSRKRRYRHRKYELGDEIGQRLLANRRKHEPDYQPPHLRV